MDPHQPYDGSSSGASPNPSAESDYELLQAPRKQQQQQQQQHGQRRQQHQRQLQEQQHQRQLHEQQHQRQLQEQQYYARQTQHGSRFTPQEPFDPFIVIQDLNAPEEFPVLPRILGEMRVTHDIWKAFMEEVLRAWEDRNPLPGKYGPAARQVRGIVDKWNVGCFKQYGIDVAFFRGCKRKSGDARTQYDTINDQLPFLAIAASFVDEDSSDEDYSDEGITGSALRSQFSHNSTLAGRQLSGPEMAQLELMRREQRRVLEEKRQAKTRSELAHSIVVFPMVPA